MAIKQPVYAEVTLAASSSDLYTSQTITPAALSAGVITVTKADVGGDSGALLSVNEYYRLIVDGNDYWDTILDNTDADEFFFRVITTHGTPIVTSVITTIKEITPSTTKTTLSEMITNAAGFQTVNVDEDWTVKDETIIFADASAADVVLQLPLISSIGTNRILIVNADVGANSVFVSPNAADQVAGGGADTDKELTGSDVVEMYVSTTTDAVNDWKLVLTI